MHYAVQGFRDGLHEQLDFILGQRLQITWENYVYDRFRGRGGAANERRRNLVLDLSRQPDPVPRNRVSEITPRIARAYSRLTEKALTRDLNELVKMDLVVREARGYRTRWELMLKFLPPTVGSSK